MSVFTGALSKDRYQLFLLSVLSLFMEMLLIRYLGTEILIFAFFKNLALMAAFLGLGLGFLCTNDKRDYFGWSTLAFFLLSGIIMLALPLHLTFFKFTNPYELMVVLQKLDPNAINLLADNTRTLLIMLGLFALSCFSFVGVGQRIGRVFEKLRPLEAYSINVLGGLLGTLLFTILCQVETSPGIWLLVSGALMCLVEMRASHVALCALGLTYCVWLGPEIARIYYGPNYIKTYWSPYYRIDFVESLTEGGKEQSHWGWHLMVCYGSFQVMLDCSPENLAKFPPAVQTGMHNAFEHPYHLTNQAPKKVLILASGSGSDVAAALRCGAEHVDAVDIDPVITKIGRTLHPEKPYASPKVKLHVMDARTYLRNCKEKYDLIVFAYLDSHTAFSCLSSMRTDNYVFTKEAFEEANKLLAPDGIMYVSFLCFKDWLWDRHGKALTEATGTVPLAFCTNNGHVDVGFMIAGPGVRGKKPSDLNFPAPVRAIDPNSTVNISEDDWPYDFLPRREFSGSYIFPLLAVLAFAIWSIFNRIKVDKPDKLSCPMFFLGMSFMLLEVRAMGDMSLLFGSTWYVNLVTISAMMVTILLGNVLATKLQPKHIVPLGVALMGTIALTTVVKVASLSSLGTTLGALAAIGLYVLPVTLAAAIFAILLKTTKTTMVSLGLNLLGGIFGIALEYFSMLLGLRALGWMAVALYGIVIATYLWASKDEANGSPLASAESGSSTIESPSTDDPTGNSDENPQP